MYANTNMEYNFFYIGKGIFIYSICITYMYMHGYGPIQIFYQEFCDTFSHKYSSNFSGWEWGLGWGCCTRDAKWIQYYNRFIIYQIKLNTMSKILIIKYTHLGGYKKGSRIIASSECSIGRGVCVQCTWMYI